MRPPSGFSLSTTLRVKRFVRAQSSAARSHSSPDFGLERFFTAGPAGLDHFPGDLGCLFRSGQDATGVGLLNFGVWGFHAAIPTAFGAEARVRVVTFAG